MAESKKESSLLK